MTAPARRKSTRVKPTRAHLRQVADVYLTAQRAGSEPAAAVAEHFGVTRVTASNWVGLARRVGELEAPE